MSRNLVDLFEADEAAPSLVGQKAHLLAKVARLGFDVPGGFVVTAGSTVDVAELSERMSRTEGDRFAVRTSAVDEDGVESSQAGRYRSFLDVDRADVANRIADCRTHAASMGGVGASAAVIVQQMVDAEAAGVAFTADPVTGDRGQDHHFCHARTWRQANERNRLRR